MFSPRIVGPPETTEYEADDCGRSAEKLRIYACVCVRVYMCVCVCVCVCAANRSLSRPLV